MAYDPATNQLILFGGDGASNDTWTWNGTTWTQLSSATSPPGRQHASMAYDPGTDQLVLFGGLGATGNFLNDTWTWNGTTWTEQSPSTSPSARYGQSMAYDTGTNQLILFGGFEPGVILANSNDTWSWNGTTWMQLSPVSSPPGRYYASMAYDSATSQLLLFGGCCENSIYVGDTWTWNGTTWTDLSPGYSPPARELGLLAYDPAVNQLVLFGGVGNDGVGLDAIVDDTWTWSGSTWTEQAVNGGGVEPYLASMTYDPGTGQLVVFGGVRGIHTLNETWAGTVSDTVTIGPFSIGSVTVSTALQQQVVALANTINTLHSTEVTLTGYQNGGPPFGGALQRARNIDTALKNGLANLGYTGVTITVLNGKDASPVSPTASNLNCRVVAALS